MGAAGSLIGYYAEAVGALAGLLLFLGLFYHIVQLVHGLDKQKKHEGYYYKVQHCGYECAVGYGSPADVQGFIAEVLPCKYAYDGGDYVVYQGIHYALERAAYDDAHGKAHDVAAHGELFEFSKKLIHIKNARPFQQEKSTGIIISHKIG